MNPTTASVAARGVPTESNQEQVPSSNPEVGRLTRSAEAWEPGGSCPSSLQQVPSGVPSPSFRRLDSPGALRAADSHASAGAAIVAVAVTDAKGRRWTRLPDAWRARAGLCGSVAAYDFDGATFVVRCRCRSDWTAGSDGLCADHFAAQLDLGA